LIPGFTVIYLSIGLLFLVAPFMLRTGTEITALAINEFLVISFAGIGFLLIPAYVAYPPRGHLGMWEGMFRLADWLNLDYNLVPSLHVALSAVCVEQLLVRTNNVGRLFLRIWVLLIAASTLFTHQHHILDVVTGYVLAQAVVKRSCWCARFRWIMPLTFYCEGKRLCHHKAADLPAAGSHNARSLGSD
jgi:membrane-associated phospholipid phosphatase